MVGHARKSNFKTWKEELNAKLSELRQQLTNLERGFRNKEQIEILRFTSVAKSQDVSVGRICRK